VGLAAYSKIEEIYGISPETTYSSKTIIGIVKGWQDAAYRP